MSSRMYRNVTTMDVEYGRFTDFRSPFVRRVLSSGSLSCLHVAIEAGMWVWCDVIVDIELTKVQRIQLYKLQHRNNYVTEGGNDARSEG